MDNLCGAYVPSRKRLRNFYKFLDFFSCSWLRFSQAPSTLNSNNDNRRQIKMVSLPLSINPRKEWKEQGRIIFLCIRIRDELQINFFAPCSCMLCCPSSDSVLKLSLHIVHLNFLPLKKLNFIGIHFLVSISCIYRITNGGLFPS